MDELRESGRRYTAATPVLVDSLQRTQNVREKQSIVRALSVPWAKKQALVPLIQEFRDLPIGSGPDVDSLRWAVGNALEILWDDTYFEDLVGLARDERFGKAREMIVLGLKRSKRPEAGDVLIELLDDPVVNGHAVKALARLKPPRARAGLERMTADSRPWVRKAATNALAKLT